MLVSPELKLWFCVGVFVARQLPPGENVAVIRELLFDEVIHLRDVMAQEFI